MRWWRAASQCSAAAGTFAGSTCDDSDGSWSLSIVWAASALGVLKGSACGEWEEEGAGVGSSSLTLVKFTVWLTAEVDDAGFVSGER